MSKAQFISTLRSLAECYQAFEACSAARVRTLRLTGRPFDMVAMLGKMPGTICKELCATPLISKGTLTGVPDRMEARGLIRHTASDADCRQEFIGPAAQGISKFERAFPAHIDHLKRAFTVLSLREFERAVELRFRDDVRDARAERQAV